MLRVNKSLCFLAVPVAISIAAILSHSAVLLVLWVLAHFIIIKAVPVFRGRESIWMFIAVFISSAPLNAYALLILYRLDFFYASFAAVCVFRMIIYYCVFLSIEEIFMGVITRIIWRRQYKLDL